jgi:hypothetical protein
LLEAQVRLAQNAEVRKDLDECQLKGSERFLILQKAKPDDVTLSQVYVHMERGEGIRKALTLSLDKTGIAAERKLSVIESFDPMDASNLAKALLGMAARWQVPNQPETPDPLPAASGMGT